MKKNKPIHKSNSPTKPFSRLFSVLLFFLLVGSTTTFSQRYIGDKHELERFATEVNNGNTFAGQMIYITQDIGSPTDPLRMMIGNDRNPFQGVFSGNNFTIYVEIIDFTNKYVGLFSQQIGGSLN